MSNNSSFAEKVVKLSNRTCLAGMALPRTTSRLHSWCLCYPLLPGQDNSGRIPIRPSPHSAALRECVGGSRLDRNGCPVDQIRFYATESLCRVEVMPFVTDSKYIGTLSFLNERLIRLPLSPDGMGVAFTSLHRRLSAMNRFKKVS
jgi:hypothetical protein